MSKKISIDFIIKKCKLQHGEKYDYHTNNFKGSNEKITIICKKHGEFKQRYYDHLKGKGCPYCSGTVKLTTKIFIKKAIEIHGYKYDYCVVDYKNTKTKVKIFCNIHNSFKQTPHDHLKGKGCPKCRKRPK